MMFLRRLMVPQRSFAMLLVAAGAHGALRCSPRRCGQDPAFRAISSAHQGEVAREPGGAPRAGALAALQVPASEPDGGTSANGARERESDETSDRTSDTAATSARRAVPLPRITSVGLFTQIYAHPRRAGSPLGYVRRGTSVPLRDAVPIPGGACVGRWYAALPRGYICNDNTSILETEQRVLSEGGDRLVRALTSASPHEGAFPYGYALSLGAPMYGKIPVAAEQAEAEATYGAPEAEGLWARGHDGLADAPAPSAPGGAQSIPWFFANGGSSPLTVRGGDGQLVRKVAPRGSMISFDTIFEADGRTWLVTPELSLVPADRTRVYRKTSFQGVPLGEGLALPIAWIRHHAAHEVSSRRSGAHRGHRRDVGVAHRSGAHWPQGRARRAPVLGDGRARQLHREERRDGGREELAPPALGAIR